MLNERSMGRFCCSPLLMSRSLSPRARLRLAESMSLLSPDLRVGVVRCGLGTRAGIIALTVAMTKAEGTGGRGHVKEQVNEGRACKWWSNGVPSSGGSRSKRRVRECPLLRMTKHERVHLNR